MLFQPRPCRLWRTRTRAVSSTSASQPNPIARGCLLNRKSGLSFLKRASILAAIAAPWLIAPPAASAQSSSALNGIASTSQGPLVQQSFTDVPVASLSGLVSQDAFNNEAAAGGALATPAGMFTLSSHACSGGRPVSGGQANGGANGSANTYYVLTSTTLPPGTPVSVSVRWAVNSNVKAVGQDMAGVNVGAQATASGRVVIVINDTLVTLEGGGITRVHNPGDGIAVFRSGTLDMESDSDEHTYTVLVGQGLRVQVEATVNAASIKIGDGTVDADVQTAMVWGVTALNPEASVVLQSNVNEPAPSASNATPAHAGEITPPRPAVGALPCFRIPTQPLPITACSSGSANFSVGVLGTGPFTYQWRKGGVPINSGAGGNPSAATAMLSLTNVSAADAGSYDCVITNPCGIIPSSAATLAINSAPTLSEQPANITICPTGSTPFSVTAAGPGPFTYNWQVQTAPTTWLAPGDDPGSPLPCGGFAYATPPNSRAVTIGIRPCPSATPGAPQHFQVRCILTSPCGSITSSEATYTICPADFNCSGAVNVQDIFDFLSAWFAADPRADFNGIGGITVQDIFDFLAAWFAGCP